jgi:hypothetical protein
VPGRDQVEDVLVIVPGILGSRLRHREHGVVWGGARTAVTFLRPSTLGLATDGTRSDPDVTPDGLVGFPLQLPGLAKITAYTALLRSLDKHFELEPERNVVVFAYDWRLSCATNARLLQERLAPVLEARRRRHAQARLVFVAHSMGGLVVAHFTDVLGGAADTKRVITIGTPFRGAPKALGALAAPPSGPLSGVRGRIQALVRTLPSIYELLPRYRAIVDGDARRALVAADLPEALQPGFARAGAFHDAIDRAPRGTYHRHVLIGSHQPTAQFATLDAGAVVLHERWAGRDERGDGTVPRQSVTPAGWDDDADAVPFAQLHVALPGTSEVVRVLHHVLTARSRADQGPARAMLALSVPDLVLAGEPLIVHAEVAEGDGDVPLLVHAEPLDGSPPPRPTTARDARFDGLKPGDYRIRLEPAVRMPDVRPVWDLVTCVE